MSGVPAEPSKRLIAAGWKQYGENGWVAPNGLLFNQTAALAKLVAEVAQTCECSEKDANVCRSLPQHQPDYCRVKCTAAQAEQFEKWAKYEHFNKSEFDGAKRGWEAASFRVADLEKRAAAEIHMLERQAEDRKYVESDLRERAEKAEQGLRNIRDRNEHRHDISLVRDDCSSCVAGKALETEGEGG